MKSHEIKKQLNEIKSSIDNLLYNTQGNRDNEVDKKIEYENTPDDKLLKDEYYGMLKKLSDVKLDLEYLDKPVCATGILRKNSRGRYETDSVEYTSGCGIEVLIYDDYDECEKWVVTRVEHNREDYYIVAYPKIKLEGLQVRSRA